MIVLLDVGGTSTRVGLSKSGAKLDRTEIMATPTGHEGLNQVADRVRVIVGSDLVEGICLGISGSLDLKHSRIVQSPNVPNWDGADLRRIFQPLTNGRVIVENDAAMVGLGESHVGAGITKGVMAYVTVSTGVGAARIVNGRIDKATFDFEPGRQIIDGQHSLEDLIGGKNIQRKYGRLPSTIDDPSLWSREVHYLAIGLYNLMSIWSPAVFVLGGSMMRDIPIDGVAKAMAQLPEVFDSIPELRPASLGQWGGLHGALIRWQQLNK